MSGFRKGKLGHSGRVTLISNMFNAKYEEATIKKRTGHRSNIVQTYNREDPSMRKNVSNLLQPPNPKKPKTTSRITKPVTTPPPDPTPPSSNPITTTSHSNTTTSSATPSGVSAPGNLENLIQIARENGGELKMNSDGSFSIKF